MKETLDAVKRGRPQPGYSFTTTGFPVSDEQIKDWFMELLAGEEYNYGYRLLAECVRQQNGLILNDKKAYRLCKELGILHPQRPIKTKHPRRIARYREVTKPDQLWQMDIKYGYVAGYDRFFFMLNIIDVFDRVIVGYYVGSSCEAKHVCQAVREAIGSRIKQGMKKPVIRTDNGSQFVSHAFGDLCAEWRIEHERIPPRSPDLNAYVESFHATLERDVLRKNTFQTFKEAYETIHQYMDFYNNRRMHGSLRKKAPAQFWAWIQDHKDLKSFFRAV